MNHVVATLTENCSVAEKRAALSIGHSLLVKYRQSSLDNSALDVLVSVYAVLSVPLISVMEFLLTVTEAPGNPEALMACKGLESAVECVRDISSMDLGDDFINALGRVANIFMRIFKLHGETFNTCQSELFELKGSVTSCVTHFLTSFDEDFEEYTSAFLQEALLMISENVDNEEAKDLIVKGIGLLCSACIGTGRKFFEDDALLNSLKDRIIVPCLIITDELIEAYTYEPDTYIVHDIEGSDQHTRRRAISDLIRALLTYVPTHSRPLFSNLANQLFETSTNDWRAKDAAIFLASNLCLHGAQSDSQRGVTKGQLDSLIPLDSFLKNIILTEITTNVSDSSPFLIKADCLRVLTAFRNFLDQATFSRLIELFPGFLSCSDEVVRTYTSNALYRFLKGPGSIITEEMVSPSAGALLAALCKGLVEDTKQNFYFMQCLMQICTSVPHCVEPYIGDVVVSLNAMLETAARNPSNPKYGLFLFETISLCISKFPAHASSVEQTIWANLVFVLANDVAEYVPFALQIMSQLLSAYPTSRTEPPAAYLDLLGPLTEIEFYSQTTGAIPGAACLLVTFIERYPAFLLAHPGGLTQKLLNIFLNLIQFKQYDHDGLSILTAMVVHYPRDAMDQYITAAFQFLLRRLESKKTPKFVRIFIIFLSITLVVRGVPDTVARVNAIQPGLFLMIFERIGWPI
ncbi:importin-alpha re-exporter protein [Angomonas deanei]|nr:importin-alpha re-exporter protein [Angomonas deanei]|eukprot:EPY28840.1 importin-alpha re-exporter protein [Angomonas deanei]